MVAEIKLFLGRKNKKGYPVIFYYRTDILRKRVSLNYYYKKEDWNFKAEMPNHNSLDFDIIYPKLMRIKNEIAKLKAQKVTDLRSYLFVVNDVDSEVKIKNLQKELKNLMNDNKMTIFKFFDLIIAEKSQKQESTRIYKQTKSHIEDYIVVDIPINAIDYEWINGFIMFKKSAGTGMPGIMTYLRTLRALYKEAQKRPSLNIKPENPFLGIIKNVSSSKIMEFALTDFEKLQQFKPPKFTSDSAAFKMQRVIDIWLLQFVIGGHDLIDIANLEWSNIKNNRLQFKRYKNRNKPDGGVLVSNLILPFAEFCIKKYSYKDDKRIFDFIPNPQNEKKYNSFRKNYNRTLKNISEAQKLTTKITSKATRYIFRSLAGELLINDLVVMQLQGHKPTGITFSYQNRLPSVIIDAQHKIIVGAVNLSKC